jgi:predicted RND superfamily exporter protein
LQFLLARGRKKGLPVNSEEMERLSNIVVKFRWLIILSVLGVTVFLGYQLKFLEVDSDIVHSLPPDDPEVKLFNEVGEDFGGNQIGMVILSADNVLVPEVLDDIAMVTDTLTEMDGIISVTSLTNMMKIKVEGDNFEVGQMINDKNRPADRAGAEALLKEITTDDMVRGTIISEDGTATAIIFTFADQSNADSLSEVVLDKIGGLPLHEEPYFGGSSFIATYVSRVVNHDLITLIPIAFFLIAFILYFSFHSLRGVILPILTAGLAIIWAMGIFSFFGFKLSMVSNNVPIIILAVGSAYAIHVLNRVNQCKEKDVKKIIRTALAFMFVPVALTALTTMTGFLSFIFGSYLSMIRDFGLLAALGTFFAGVFALTLVPSLLAVAPHSKKKEGGRILSGHKRSYLIDYFLKPLKGVVDTHRGRIFAGWILLLVISLFGVTKIKRSVSVSGYFKKHHPAAIADRIMSEKFGGSKSVFVVFHGDMQSPELLKMMLRTEEYMKNSPFITATQSIADVVARLNRVMGDTVDIPDDEGEVGQLWFLLDQQESISRLVTPDLDKGIIIAKYDDNGTNNINDFRDYMHKFFKENISQDYSIQITGMPFINAQLDHSLVKSQITSLTLAIILVLALVSLMFGSFREGLFASIPIIMTISILYGIMGLTGIPLNVVTVLVASIAMGIGIDYSIHFVSHFNHAVKHHKKVLPAIDEAIMVSGNAIMINFISVSAGFLVLIFSQLVPMIYFGILIALSMLGSSMGALTLLPSIILLRGDKIEDKKKLKNS